MVRGQTVAGEGGKEAGTTVGEEQGLRGKNPYSRRSREKELHRLWETMQTCAREEGAGSRNEQQ